jgi:hypothetical protein
MKSVGSPSLWILLLTGALLIPTNAQVPPKTTAVEQTTFSMEFPFEHPVPLNEAAKRALCADKAIADVMKDDHLTIDTIPDNWFTASVVHLGHKTETDLVVMGVGVSLGPSTAAFWLLRQSSNSYEIVLATHSHDLTLLKTKTHGLREVEVGIESFAAAGDKLSTGNGRGADLCKFVGHRYQIVDQYR